MNQQKRIEIEKTIVAMIVEDALAAGYSVTLNNGGDTDELENSKDKAQILAAMFATDDERLTFHSDASRVGWVYFVYGNDGWDVVNDCIESEHMKKIMARADAYADTLS
jgi:hypothetical protein